jgi:tetratricopeptide (TPR) repeat protein
MELFCTDCGMRNSADSKYCKECGQKVNDGYRTMMLSIEDLQAVQTEENQARLTKLLDMAFWHNQAGNIDAAVLACEAALAIHPNSTTAHSLLGSLYEKKDNDAKAIEHFEAVVRLNPDSAADAAKLDQVRRGVHVKAVQPPPAYKWLPPALVSMNWSKWKPNTSGLNLPNVSRPAWLERLPKPSPLVAATAVTVVVLIAGLLVIHPGRTVGEPSRSENSLRRAPVNTLALGSIGAPPVVSNPPEPLVLKSGPNAPAQTVLAPPVDPFSETLAPGTPTVPFVPPTPRVARAPRPDHHGSSLGTLPPLNLHAEPEPSDSGTIPPASVTLPPGTQIPSVPQHTVVVSNLGGPNYPPAQTASISATQNGASNDLSSHIHISINNSPSDNSVSISDHDVQHSAAHSIGGGDGEDGDSYQQAALALQQQGDYRRAQAAYQKAIRAYKAQIAAGRDADAANQGLAASQTGLQICEQSAQ